MTTIKLRTIRSFVCRKGRMLESQKLAIQNYWAQYGLMLGTEPLDAVQVFHRQAPIIVEIGFGMGQSLLHMAEQNPEQDFIGIEVHQPGVGALLQGIAQKQLSNIRIFRADALEVLQQMIIDHSITGVQIFFPDPWPKRRHHKRRLIQASFLQLLQRKLKPGGFVHIATDWQDYANQALRLLEQAEGFNNANPAGGFSPRPETRPLTRYERRGQRLGHDVWDIVFTKTDSADVGERLQID